VPAHGPIHRWTEPVFSGMTRGYRWLLGRALRIPVVIIAIGAVVSLAAVNLFQALPKEFAPTEDRGYVIIPVTAPEGASIDYTRERVREIERALKPVQDRGVVASTLSLIAPGFARPAPVNAGLVIVRLVPWEQRDVKQQELQQQLQGIAAGFPGARATAVNPGSLGQRGFQQPIQFVLGGPDYQTLREWRDLVTERAQATGMFVNIDSDYKESQPDLRVQIDRARAADLGISIEEIGRTLELMFGEREVSTFINRGQEYPVIVRARSQDRATPADLANTFIRAQNGDLVPLSAFVKLSEAAAPQELNRFDRLRAITIESSLAPGVTIGQGLETLERIVREELPAEVRIGYKGQSKEFKDASSAIYVTFGLAMLVVFLVLAAQFESWINPFIVMLTVPLALTGGLLALYMTGQSLNIYSQIGMILLIGLMTKNGILIVEFANQLRQRGLGVREAVVESSVLRLRPILMTSIATMGGAIPLAWSVGAGAEARNAIGWVIVGGVALSTLLTTLVVPSVYLLIGGFSRPANYTANLLDRLREKEEAGGGHAGPHGAHGRPVVEPAE
jgi:multidrug efflux pump